MKIKIIKSSVPCWYSFEIGKIYDVIYENKNKYVVVKIEGMNSGTIEYFVTKNDYEIVKDFKFHEKLNVSVIKGGLPAHGRNAGALKAETKYILFIDADIRIYDKNLIYNSIKLAEEKEAWLISPFWITSQFGL